MVLLGETLNLFGATGQETTPDLQVYILLIMELPYTYPWLHEKFAVKGMHAVWTIDRSYHRANYDESSKNTMGVTSGWGFRESVRTRKIYTRHYCAEIHTATSEFTKSQC